MSLMGTYRTTYREQSAMLLMRRKGHSINQIAKVLGRSTKTVWKYVKLGDRDNRRQSFNTRAFNAATFRGRFRDLSIRVRLFLKELCNWDEAMNSPAVPLKLLSFLSEASKNNSEEEEEEPA